MTTGVGDITTCLLCMPLQACTDAPGVRFIYPFHHTLCSVISEVEQKMRCGMVFPQLFLEKIDVAIQM